MRGSQTCAADARTHLPARLELLPLATLMAGLILPAIVRHRLPADVAAHLTHGVPDDSAPLWVIVAVPVAVGAVPALAWATLVRRVGCPALLRAVAFVCLMTYAVFSVSFIEAAVVATNLDVVRWQDARSPAWAAWVVGLGSGVGFLGSAGYAFALLRRGGLARPEPMVAPSPRDLAGRERAAWIGYAVNRQVVRSARVTAAVCLVVAIWLRWWPGLVVAVGIAGAGTLGQATVVFDGHRMRLRPGTPWPWWSIPIHEVAAAELVTVDPARWFGWGLRVGAGVQALIVRRGPALRLVRTRGPDIIVSVDDAPTGVALINAALTSSRSDHDS